jgi:hypothetical protein
MARITSDIPDDEAIALMERALAALDSAKVNSSEAKAASIKGLQESIAGMKEIRSMRLLDGEPWRLAKALNRATLHLSEGAKEVSSGARDNLGNALFHLSAGLKTKRSGKDPREMLMSAAMELCNAEKVLSLNDEGKRSGEQMLTRAAEILTNQAGRGGESTGDEQNEQATSSQLNFGAETDAIALIARAMVMESMEKLEEPGAIFTWDESMNLITGSSSGKVANVEKIEELQADPEPDPIPKNDLPVLEVSAERIKAKELILADGTLEDSEVCVSDAENPVNGSLVPLRAAVVCSDRSYICLNPVGALSNVKSEKSAPEKRANRIDAPEKETKDDSLEDLAENLKEDIFEKVEHIHSLDEDKPKREFSYKDGAMLLLKALMVVVVLLLAIEAVLYLI